jgi:simple sugar transport system ATP-binding protein
VVEFFGIIRSLRDAGKALVFITHKLGEVLQVADRISVLREGKIVGEGDPKTTTNADLAEMMVGRQVRFAPEKRTTETGGPLIDVTGLTVLNDRDELAVAGVDFAVHEGEIVGIAGVQGNGQTELVEALTGLRPVSAGHVTYLGGDITRVSTRERHKRGIAHIPEDRQRMGMIADFNVAENCVLDMYYDDNFSTWITLRWPDVYDESNKIVRDFDVRTESIFALAGHLSGGNQQKLVVGRELSSGIARDLRLVVAAQPTRGVDVGSIEYIHDRIVEARDKGVGVLMVSTELDEIMALSDRILVMFRGRIVAEFKAAEASVKEVGLAMAGVAA